MSSFTEFRIQPENLGLSEPALGGQVCRQRMPGSISNRGNDYSACFLLVADDEPPTRGSGFRV